MLRKSTGTLALILFAFQSHAAPVSGQGTWETTLLPRDADPNTPGIEAYYDTDLNITWLADANYAQTSGFDADGNFTFQEANSWVFNLTYLGVNNWHGQGVADTSPPGCQTLGPPLPIPGPDCGVNVNTNSTLAHMYYITLGNDSSGLTNTGPFSNVSRGFWASDSYIGYDDVWWREHFFAYSFDFGSGYQWPEDTFAPAVKSKWAITDGDPFAAAVPIPAAVWLLGSALGVLGVMRRRAAT